MARLLGEAMKWKGELLLLSWHGERWPEVESRERAREHALELARMLQEREGREGEVYGGIYTDGERTYVVWSDGEEDEYIDED